MDKYNTIRDLVNLLNRYTKAYDEGHPEISDKEWDELYYKLESYEKETGIVFLDSPTQIISYDVVNELIKVKHNHPMLSLKKTKQVEDVLNFADGKELIAMQKMDGLTCSILYEGGHLISAETRGNGEVGEDITHNIVHVQGVPLTISYSGRLVVDGEVICTLDDFKAFKDTYKNPRNFASGSIRLLNSKECSERKLTFVAWDCIDGLEDYSTLSDKLFNLKALGFKTVAFNTLQSKELKLYTEVIDLVKGYAAEDGYPIDGIVFKYNDCNYYDSLGRTDHHFRGGLAFKFYDEEYLTTLKDIEWTMGRTGILTPIAVFEPVDADGSEIERASLHNLTIMKETLGEVPFIGQPIIVYKANEIIPQLVKGCSDTLEHWGDNAILPPPCCPICGGDLGIRKDNDSEFVYCQNENCEGKLINKLDHFCGKKGLDIKGLSKATIGKLMDWGWIRTIADIYNLKPHREEWIKKSGFGEKSVDKILFAISDKQINANLTQFISAIGIPLIGTVQSKELVKHFPTWIKFREAVDNKYDFSELDGFGVSKRDAILNYNYTEADTLAYSMIQLNTIEANPEDEREEQLTCKGLTFVVTGSMEHFKNRADLTKNIELRGGKVVGSISKKTNYLINNDINSESSKNVTAKKLGIPIISELDYIAKFEIK